MSVETGLPTTSIRGDAAPAPAPRSQHNNTTGGGGGGGGGTLRHMR